MKTLIVIRHAKAVAHDAAPTDFERALAPRGHEEAARVATHLSAHCPAPDMMIVSTAKRTEETAVHFAAAWNIDQGAIVHEPRVYDAPLRMLMTLIAELPENVSTVAIVGHNPSVSDLVYYLTSGEYAGMSTSTVVIVDMQHAVTWDEVASGTGRVRAVYEAATLVG